MADRPLTQQPYWTPADQAELELLTYELIEAMCEHKKRCDECRPRGLTCRPIAHAIQAVLDWRERRILHSRARWLRLTQELEDVQRQIAQLERVELEVVA